MLEKIADKLLTTITDPFMLFALLVIGGLFYLLVKRDAAMKTIFSAMKEQTATQSACNSTLSSLLTLVEVLVYGKGGKII